MIVRPAAEGDVAELGRMSATLVRMHHAFDPQRFFLVEQLEGGYGNWLAKAIKRETTVVLVAEDEKKILGYVYGSLEPRDWMLLRDACGVLQDIFVDESARRAGVARTLVKALCEHFRKLGAPRVVLTTAAKNAGAQAFFASMGFRPTMIEMTRESD